MTAVIRRSRTARRVSVAFARLPRWLDGFADNHGGLTTEADPDRVLVTAADGARVWIEVPFGPWEAPRSRPLTALQLHLNRPRRIGVLLVRRGGYAAGVFAGASWSRPRSARPTSRAPPRPVAGRSSATPGVGRTRPRPPSPRRPRWRSGSCCRAAALVALICGGDRAAVDATLADPRLAPLLPLRRAVPAGARSPAEGAAGHPGAVPDGAAGHPPLSWPTSVRRQLPISANGNRSLGQAGGRRGGRDQLVRAAPPRAHPAGSDLLATSMRLPRQLDRVGQLVGLPGRRPQPAG